MENQKICPNCKKPLAGDVPLGLCPECLIKAGFPTESPTAAGANFVPPTVEEIARLFPQLEILGFLGKGGMGAVYKARQLALDRLVALKVLPPTKSAEPGFAERFAREARALARLNHPNIVAVHDFGSNGDLPYLVMELVDGVNLREMEQVGRLSPEQALAIVPQICEALQYAHNQGIVHRDIKPENLLLDKNGRVKITDFGIAKILNVPAGKVSLTGVKDVMGTPHYMAPEQIERPQAVDHRADIYSLGVVFYEMLTGELPLGKFQPPSQKVQVDVRLDEVVLRTLEKEPARRYQQASEVRMGVENIASTPPPASTPVAAPAPGRGTSDKIILPAFLLALFFGVFGAHRFYVGKIRTAILQLGMLFAWIPVIVAIVFVGDRGEPGLGLFLGALVVGCGIWATVDWILLACKAFTDGQGRRMTNWVHPNDGAAKPPHIPPVGNVPPAAAAGSQTPGGNKSMIIAPAVGLMVAGGLRVMSALTVLLFFGNPVDVVNRILAHLGIDFRVDWGGMIATRTIVFVFIPALLVIFGAVKMSQVRGYGWAVAASILSIVSFSFIGFGVGVWALIILMRADVKAAFAESRRVSPSTAEKWPRTFALAAGLSVLLVLAVNVFGRSATAESGVSKDATAAASTVADHDDNSISKTDPNSQIFEAGDATDFSKSLAVAGTGGKLMMKLDRGDVQVIGSDQNAVQIQVKREVTHASDAEAAKILKEERLVIKQNGNEISITSQEPSSLRQSSLWGLLNRPNLEAHYQITVPRKFETHVETLGGGIKTSDIKGNVFARTAGGDLHFDHINGKVDGQTLGGSIHATECDDELVAHTEGGSISVKKFAGPSVQATTSGGSVSAEFITTPKSDCELHTMGGNVTISIPDSSAVTVHAETMGGSVNTDLPVQVSGRKHNNSLDGTINGGGPVLKLETMGGNIDVLKAGK